MKERYRVTILVESEPPADNYGTGYNLLTGTGQAVFSSVNHGAYGGARVYPIELLAIVKVETKEVAADE